VFLYFLKEHNQTVYLELSQNYSKMLSKIYYNNFKSYVDDLNKLLDNSFNVEYTFFLDSTLVYKLDNFNNYSIDNRIKILDNLDEFLIVAHYELKSNKKFYLE